MIPAQYLHALVTMPMNHAKIEPPRVPVLILALRGSYKLEVQSFQ